MCSMPQDEMKCRDCRYILNQLPIPQKLPEPRCPECGRSFDPNDPVTYWSHMDEERRSGIIILAIASTSMILVVVLWFMIIAGLFPQSLYQHNNVILVSTAILSLIVEIVGSILAFRKLLKSDWTPARVFHFCTIGVGILYLMFFGMLTL